MQKQGLIFPVSPIQLNLHFRTAICLDQDRQSMSRLDLQSQQKIAIAETMTSPPKGKNETFHPFPRLHYESGLWGRDWPPRCHQIISRGSLANRSTIRTQSSAMNCIKGRDFHALCSSYLWESHYGDGLRYRGWGGSCRIHEHIAHLISGGVA